MTTKKLTIVLAATAAIIIGYLCFVLQAHTADDLLKWFGFSTEKSLQEWKEKLFKGKVAYEVVSTNGDGFLSARSVSAASGLYYKVKFRPKDRPYISWRWGARMFPGETLDEVKTDDYAGRIYIIFPAFFFPNTKALGYLWARDLPEGSVVKSPKYPGNIRMIVLRSGDPLQKGFLQEERNIYEDYKVAFGRYPRKRVGAVAVMTDSETSRDEAQGVYDEIKIGYSAPLYAQQEA